MRFYIRTLTASEATAYDTLDAAVRQARATLKLQEQRGRHVTDKNDKKEIREGGNLINTLWIEDDEDTVVRFIYP